MVIEIRPPNNSEKDVKVDHMPCNIDANETAQVENYFTPSKKIANNKEILSATFRGRPLDGKEIKVPEGYVGFVLTEKQKPFSDEESRTLNVAGKFTMFNQWYLDSQYTNSNSVEVSLSTWANKISTAIHDPIVIKNEPE